MTSFNHTKLANSHSMQYSTNNAAKRKCGGEPMDQLGNVLQFPAGQEEFLFS